MVRLRTVRPTRRGIGASAVAVAAVALGLTTGGRPLEAVALPVAVAVAVGAVQLARAKPPTVTRSVPDPDVPGARRTVAVTVESALPCTVTEPVGEGLARPDGDGAVTEPLGHGGRFEYAVDLRRRGRHRLGPARCRLTDSLGLFRADVETDGSATVLVYPRVYELEPGALPEIGGRGRGGRREGNGDRSVFDRLRRFAPGDAMRDIHWRASAKRPDGEFVVSEYEGRATSEAVTVVGEATPDGADAMASVVGSVALHLAESGVAVTVAVPDGERSLRSGDAAGALRLLATTGGGTRTDDERRTADVYVRGDGDGVTVRVDGRTLDFDAAAVDRRGRGVVG